MTGRSRDIFPNRVRQPFPTKWLQAHRDRPWEIGAVGMLVQAGRWMI